MTFDAHLITRRYFSDFEDPSLINGGWCFVWAWMARVHFGEDAALCLAMERTQYVHKRLRLGRRGHAFVKVGRLYVDAERPNGVTRFDALPAVRDVAPRARRDVTIGMKPDDFYLAWERAPARDINFRTQGLKPWPTSIPKRKPRPLTNEEMFDAFLDARSA